MNDSCLLDTKIRAVAEMIFVSDRIVVFTGAGVSTESGIPDCEKCHGILKPDIVFFGEALLSRVKDAAIKHSRNCNFLIAIDSSLVVYPAAFIPVYAKEAGAKLVIINIGKTPCDELADIVINNKAGETMARIVKTSKTI